ncbi:TonB-dependent receptor [Caulobacter sp. KR2-114]|uniref:TonB-dependent receptor n=1 Tax=Caulobacter sp. KR2-114 TaxID=3400912 RepID=UPI003C0B93A5
MSVGPRVGKVGIVGYARRRPMGGAVMAGAVALAPGAAIAATATVEADVANEVSAVDVHGAHAPLQGDTGIATLPTTVQDTPQAIQVIGADQLKAQGVASLEQALRNVPGITIAIGEGGTLNGDQFKIRGFDAKDDVYVDGLRDFGVYTRDSFDAEAVEVLKGPSGAMFGRGTTGGVINTVSKGPVLKDFADVDGYVGGGSYYRGLADISHVINDTTAVRLNLMGTRAGVVGRDDVYSHRWGLAAAAGFGLGTRTSFTINYVHQQDTRLPDYGIVIGQPTGSLVALPLTEYGLRASTFDGYDTDIDRTTADIVTARFKSQVRPWLTVTSDTRVGVYSRYFQYTTVDGCYTDPVTHQTCADALLDNNPATVPIGTIGGSGPYQMNAWGAQNISTVRIEAPVGGFRNELIGGVDVSYQENKKRFWVYSLPATIPGGYLGSAVARTKIPVNLLNPNNTPPPGYAPILPTAANLTCPTGVAVCTSATSSTVTNTWGDATDVGGFLTDRFWFTRQLSLMGSVRVDGYWANFNSVAPGNVLTPISVKSTLFDPRVSLIYEPSSTSTVYVSWGRSATPQGASIVGAATAVALTAKDLQPEVANATEVGAKIGVWGGRLSLTGSLFDVRKNNATQTDPSTGFLLAQSGEKQEVRGVELGLTGKLAPGWTVSANYTYLDARVRQSFVNCVVPTSTAGTPTTVVCPVGATAALPVENTVAEGRQVLLVPRNAASIFTSYDFKGPLAGLEVGGDVVYQSRLYAAYTAVSASYASRSTLVASKIAEIPESVTLDAFVAWRFSRYRVALNVYNLADRLNYTQVFANRAVPAAGRTFVVSLGASF